MTDTEADDGTVRARPVPFISRVRLENYKSIASCDVRLGPLTILVGPNGSGKSNFLDALAFLARAVRTTPAEAIDERGGVTEILRRVPSAVDTFTIAVESGAVSYLVEIGRRAEILREEFTLPGGQRIVDDEPDRMLHPLMHRRSAGPFVYELGRMQFYNFEAETLRRPEAPSATGRLGPAGEYIGDVLVAMVDRYRKRLDAYMRAIVPDIEGIDPFSAGGYSTIALRAMTGADGAAIAFGPKAMSDGTVRAAGVLAALFQPEVLAGRIPLVGIEEPETALHPAAAGVLFDALTEASTHVQVVATTQSADLLDREDLDIAAVRPVTMREGLTVIGEVDEASRDIVRKNLYTLGELMRGNQLAPAPADGEA